MRLLTQTIFLRPLTIGSDDMRFGAQRYQLKRSIANPRELLQIFQTWQSQYLKGASLAVR